MVQTDICDPSLEKQKGIVRAHEESPAELMAPSPDPRWKVKFLCVPFH